MVYSPASSGSKRIFQCQVYPVSMHVIYVTFIFNNLQANGPFVEFPLAAAAPVDRIREICISSRKCSLRVPHSNALWWQPLQTHWSQATRCEPNRQTIGCQLIFRLLVAKKKNSYLFHVLSPFLLFIVGASSTPFCQSHLNQPWNTKRFGNLPGIRIGISYTWLSVVTPYIRGYPYFQVFIGFFHQWQHCLYVSLDLFCSTRASTDDEATMYP